MLRRAVETDRRQAAFDQRHQVLLRLQRRAEDDALHALRHEGLRILLLAVGAALRIAQQHAVATRDGRILDPARQRAEERVGDRRHEQPDHRHVAGLQTARRLVGPKVEFGDGLAHARQRIGAHARFASIEHVGHRADRHAGALRHVLDRGGGGLVHADQTPIARGSHSEMAGR